MKLIRTFIRLMLLLIIILALFNITIYIAFLLPPIQNLVRTNIESLLSSILKGNVTVGSLQINIFSGAHAQNILLFDPKFPENSIFVENILLNYQPTSLFHKTFNITSIAGNKICAKVSLSPNKVKTLPFLPYPDTSSNPETSQSNWKVVFNKIDLDNFNLTFSDSSHNLTAEIINGSAHLLFLSDVCFNGFLSIPQGKLNHEYWNGSFDNLTTDFLINESQLAVDSLKFSGSTTSLIATGTMPFSSSKQMSIKVSFKSSLLPIDFSSFLPQLESAGNISGSTFLKGSILQPEWYFDFSVNDIILFNIPVQSISVDALLMNDSIIAAADFQSPGLSGDSFFSVKIDSILLNHKLKHYSADFNINQFDPYLLQYLNKDLKSIPSGNINIQCQLSGTNPTWPDTVIFKTAYSGKTITPAMYFQGKIISFDWYANAWWDNNNAHLSGIIDKQGNISGKVTANIKSPDLISNLIINETVSGQVSLNSEFKYLDGHFHALADIYSNNIVWKTVRISDLFCQTLIQNNKVYLDTVHSVIEGKMDSIVPLFTNYNAGGFFQLVLSGSGPLINPDITFHLRGRQVSFNNLFFSDDLYGIFYMNGFSKASWNNFTFSNRNHKIISNGSFVKKINELSLISDAVFLSESESGQDSSGVINFNATIQNESIETRFTAQNAELNVAKSFFVNSKPFSGNLNAAGELNGPISNPAGKLIFNTQNFCIKPYLVNSVNGELTLRDSLINAEISVLFPDSVSSVSINSELPLLPGKNWILDKTGTRIPLIYLSGDCFHLSALQSSVPEIIEGYGSGNFNVKLSHSHDEWNLDGRFIANMDSMNYLPLDISANSINLSGILSGTLKSPQISFSTSARDIYLKSDRILSLYSNGMFKNDTLYIDSSYALFDNSGFLQLSGIIPVLGITSIPIPQISYSIQNVPLSIFNSFLPYRIIKKGTLHGDGTISNRYGRFFSQGELFVNDGVIDFGLNEKSTGPVNGELILKDDSLIVKSFKARMGDGDLTLSGFSIIKLNEIPELNFNITSENASFQIPDLVKGNIDSIDLSLKTIDNRFNLNGNVFLGETRFIRNIRINDLISQNVLRPDAPNSRESSFLELVDIEIELQLDENLFIDMNLGNLQLEGYVAISGPLISPGFIGDLQIIDGYIYYLDREFFITEGNISNFDPEFNPSFDITGTTDVIAYTAAASQTQSYSITLLISGDLEKPQVDLTAEPPLSKPDIISVLTLGSTLGSVGSDLANRIGNLVGQEIIGLGTSKLERILDLQSINISGDIFNTATGKGPEVTLTRRFSRRLIITYTTGFADLFSPKISAIFRLFPFLFLTGETNEQGADIGLRFRTNR